MILLDETTLAELHMVEGRPSLFSALGPSFDVPRYRRLSGGLHQEAAPWGV